MVLLRLIALPLALLLMLLMCLGFSVYIALAWLFTGDAREFTITVGEWR